jgi:hypothetical protein
MKYLTAMGLLAMCMSLPTHAGLYSDDLARCLVTKTTSEDKNVLVRWVIAISTVHPAVQSVANVNAETRTQANRGIARVFERLLTQDCPDATRLAIKYEGSAAMQLGFQTLGQVAMAELFADPAVAAELGEFGKMLDADKLRGVLEPQK